MCAEVDESKSRISTIGNGFPFRAVDWFLQLRPPHAQTPNGFVLTSLITRFQATEDDIGHFVVTGRSARTKGKSIMRRRKVNANDSMV